jgi:hypothetical protein
MQDVYVSWIQVTYNRYRGSGSVNEPSSLIK